MKNKIIIATACLTMAFSANAQDIPFWGHNYADRFSVAPAFAGFNGNDEAFISYRKSMFGIEGASKIMKLDVNGDIMNQNAGYGVNITSEKSGNFTNLFTAITYAYHIKFSSDASLSLAVSPTVVRSSYNLAKATTFGAQVDPVFQNEAGLSATAFDAGVSLMFNVSNLYFSVNVPRTICGDLKFANGIYNYDRRFNGELSYAIETGNMMLEPIADISLAQKGGLDYRASLAAKYNQRAWLILSYSSQSWIGIGAGFAAGGRIAVNYQYETGTSAIAQNCSGTHEITVGFCISKNQKRKEPTAFADDDCGSTPIIQPTDNSAVEKKLQDEIRMRENEIKRLEDMIQEYNSKLPTNPSSNVEPTPNNPVNPVVTPSNNPQTNPSTPEPSEEWQPPVVFNYVIFGFGNARLFSSSKTEIDRCVNIMKKNTNTRIRIMAYTDEVGSADYCRMLSKQRAEVIKKYMTDNGIDDNRIQAEGMGKIAYSGNEITTEERISLNRVEYSWSK